VINGNCLTLVEKFSNYDELMGWILLEARLWEVLLLLLLLLLMLLNFMF
jgi:hypothetical protein